MNLVRMAIIPALVTLGACTTLPQQAVVHYSSYPQGALVIQKGVVIGRTPMTRYYHTGYAAVTGGCVDIAPVSLRWQSGAEVVSAVGKACAARNYALRIVRPADAPGVTQDAAWYNRRTFITSYPPSDRGYARDKLGEVAGASNIQIFPVAR